MEFLKLLESAIKFDKLRWIQLNQSNWSHLQKFIMELVGLQ